MTRRVWSVRLALMWCAALASAEVKTVTVCAGEDIHLDCDGANNILALAWYKTVNGTRHGIVRTGDAPGQSKPYSFERSPPPSLTRGHSLLLLRATAEDAGTYECAVTANVGHKNHNHCVNLGVEACTTTVFNATSTPCNKLADKLPIMWSVIGYLTVGATKAVLSLICILVCRAVHARHAR